MLDTRIIDYINRLDRFASGNDIRLTKVEAGYAEAELTVSEKLLNGNDVVQGGAIFTLADIAFAGAANSENEGMVTQSSHLTFLRPGTGKKLFASARVIHRGRTTGLYSVEIRNEEGKLVASGQMNGFATGKPLIED